MPARFSHGSATPAFVEVQLHEMQTRDAVPDTFQRTATGVRVGQYIHGTRYRLAELTIMVRNSTEHNNFLSFHRTAKNANTRFTFTADIVNYPTDTWSAVFASEPVFDRIRMGTKIVGAFRVQIEDVPVSL